MVSFKILEDVVTIEKALTYEDDTWRVPSLSELQLLYVNSKNSFGNFGCWSSSQSECKKYYWSLGFYTGNIYLNPKENINRVVLINK